jgi:predicted dienelactone hydrolase
MPRFLDFIRRVAPARWGVAALLLAACGAHAGEVVVGTTTLEFKDATRQRSIVSEFWFEAAPGTVAESFVPLPPLQALALAPSAKPPGSPARRPLIVLSHGNWATRYAYAWLATELVKAGYVVLSPSHPGTMFGDLRPEYRARLWERALDVSLVLDRVLADPAWSERIDAHRIGFAGHSFGGWTGVSLAGGRYSYDRQLQACRDQLGKDQYCTGLVADFDPATPVADGTRSFKDERFKAFYLMASGPAAGFDDASLHAIRMPMVFDTAVADAVLAPGIGSSLFARRIPGAVETLRDVGHFSYAPLCKPLVGRLLAGQVCEDPPGVDRAGVHARVAADAVRFFKAHL